MSKAEELITALNCFKTRQPKCGQCQYNPHPGRDWPYGCISGQGKMVNDAQTILADYDSAREPVKPVLQNSGGGTTLWFACGACMTPINPDDKFCHECGRAVKWHG